MTTQPIPNSDLITLAAITHIEHVVLPQLAEPDHGALKYAFLAGKNGGLDQALCTTIGKVIILVAHCKNLIQGDIFLRGRGLGLSWDNNYPAAVYSQVYPTERVFVVAVPPSQIHAKIEFKLVNIVKGASFWQPGNNCLIDLSHYGHIVSIECEDVTFQK